MKLGASGFLYDGRVLSSHSSRNAPLTTGSLTVDHGITREQLSCSPQFPLRTTPHTKIALHRAGIGIIPELRRRVVAAGVLLFHCGKMGERDA